MQIASACRSVHRYAGLAAGAAVCVLALSGSLLVFRPELERLTRPDLFDVRPVGSTASLADLHAIAVARFPTLNLYRVRLPHHDRTSYEFIFGTGGRLTTRVYVDPNTRRVLGARTAQSDFFLWLQSLHFDLLAAETGRRVNGGIAAVLLLLGVSGLALWFLNTASWSAKTRPRWRVRPARLHWGLHVALGFWGLPFLALMGSTALYFAFHEPIARLVYALTRTAPPPPPPRVQSAPEFVPLDSLLRQARALEPAGEFTLIRLPRATGQPVTFNYVLFGDWSDLGANGIHFDPNTGDALRIDRVRDMQLGARIVAAFVPLHFGTFGRTPTRVLWAALGSLPSLLFITGLAMWLRRRSRRGRPEGSSSELGRFDSFVEVRKP